MAIRRNSPETAEEYLRIIVQEGFAPAFAEQGYTLPAKIDIDFGFTSHGTPEGTSRGVLRRGRHDQRRAEDEYPLPHGGYR